MKFANSDGAQLEEYSAHELAAIDEKLVKTLLSFKSSMV